MRLSLSQAVHAFGADNAVIDNFDAHDFAGGDQLLCCLDVFAAGGY